MRAHVCSVFGVEVDEKQLTVQREDMQEIYSLFRDFGLHLGQKGERVQCENMFDVFLVGSCFLWSNWHSKEEKPETRRKF